MNKGRRSAQSPKGNAALHYHLLTLPIDEGIFNPKGAPPDTNAKRWAKEYSQNAAQQWIQEFYDNPMSKLAYYGMKQTVWRVEDVFSLFHQENPGIARTVS